MKFDLKRPCPACPFRSDVTPYIRAARVKEIERGLVREQGTFACHKTVDYENEDEDGEAEHCPSEGEQHCAGALILLERIGRPNQMMRIAERLGMYDAGALDIEAPVYGSFRAMYQAHIAAAKRV
jgi:hypothetical protein